MIMSAKNDDNTKPKEAALAAAKELCLRLQDAANFVRHGDTNPIDLDERLGVDTRNFLVSHRTSLEPVINNISSSVPGLKAELDSSDLSKANLAHLQRTFAQLSCYLSSEGL
jgi:hypothetical protein